MIVVASSIATEYSTVRLREQEQAETGEADHHQQHPPLRERRSPRVAVDRDPRSWASTRPVPPIVTSTTAIDPGTLAQLVVPDSGRRTPRRPPRTSNAERRENIPK
jgi:hypothetical protein